MKNVKSTENRIAMMLKTKGWSQAELARKLGVSAQSVQYWTTGKTFPRSDKLAQLSVISGYPQSGFWVKMPHRHSLQLKNTIQEKTALCSMYWMLNSVAATELMYGEI